MAALLCPHIIIYIFIYICIYIIPAKILKTLSRLSVICYQCWYIFQVLFRLVPKSLGLLNIQSLSFTVSYRDSSSTEPVPSVRGKLMLSVQGPRLNNTMAEKNSVVYGQDKRLLVDVQPPMPKIKVCISTITWYNCIRNHPLLCGSQDTSALKIPKMFIFLLTTLCQTLHSSNIPLQNCIHLQIFSVIHLFPM